MYYMSEALNIIPSDRDRTLEMSGVIGIAHYLIPGDLITW